MEINTFNPVNMSNAENEFLLEHVGKPPIVALKEVRFPVNAAAVKPVLERVFELEQQKIHEGIDWVGTEKIKESIRVWQRENGKWASDAKRKRNAPRWPSLYSFDARGKGHRAGPGSDCGQVRTYFDAQGNRQPFELNLLLDYQPEWLAPAITEVASAPELYLDESTHRYECRVKLDDGSICGHTESYKAESRSSKSAARARISKHLRSAKAAPEAHRELHTLEFGGSDA